MPKQPPKQLPKQQFEWLSRQLPKEPSKQLPKQWKQVQSGFNAFLAFFHLAKVKKGDYMTTTWQRQHDKCRIEKRRVVAKATHHLRMLQIISFRPFPWQWTVLAFLTLSSTNKLTQIEHWESIYVREKPSNFELLTILVRIKHYLVIAIKHSVHCNMKSTLC